MTLESTANHAGRAWWAIRNGSTILSAAGLGLLIASGVMMGIALVLGVHCPACDRLTLGADYERWVTYFGAKDLLAVAGVVLALVGTPFATRRRYGVAALLVAAVGLFLTPG